MDDSGVPTAAPKLARGPSAWDGALVTRAGAPNRLPAYARRNRARGA